MDGRTNRHIENGKVDIFFAVTPSFVFEKEKKKGKERRREQKEGAGREGRTRKQTFVTC